MSSDGDKRDEKLRSESHRWATADQDPQFSVSFVFPDVAS